MEVARLGSGGVRSGVGRRGFVLVVTGAGVSGTESAASAVVLPWRRGGGGVSRKKLLQDSVRLGVVQRVERRRMRGGVPATAVVSRRGRASLGAGSGGALIRFKDCMPSGCNYCVSNY